MATIPTPEQGKPILDFSAGTFDGNSNLFQSRNGATEHVNGDDVADYVNTSRIYNGLETASKTPIGAINEINAKEASDIDYDNTSSGLNATDVQAAIDEVFDDGFYHAGDTVTLSGLALSCYSTSARLDIYVPLPKDFDTSSVSLSISGSWRLIFTRNDTLESILVLNNAALSTIGTVSISKLTGGISIRVALNSGVIGAWGVGTIYGMGSNTLTFSSI